MNDLELTELFIEFSKTQSHLFELKFQIEQEVLSRKKSSVIAGVSAKYYKESEGTPDYEGSVAAYLGAHPLFDRNYLDVFSETKVTFDWKAICHRFSIGLVPGKPKPARVVIG